MCLGQAKIEEKACILRYFCHAWGMKYMRCGKSGVMLPQISLGLWHNFGAYVDMKNACEMVATALDLGITHFDLADNYGPPPGTAEITFGKMLKHEFAGKRDEMLISTKAGHLMWDGPYGDWGSRKHMLSGLDQSLHRLQLEYVDIFYSHRYDSETPLEETMGALISAVQQGKALYVGISKYPADVARRACQILKNAGVPCLIHQLRYNLLDRSAEDGVFAAIEETQTGCIAFSPLAQGVLSGKYLEGIPNNSRAASDSIFLTADRIAPQLPRVRAFAELAAQRGESLATLALNWILQHPVVNSALIGARTPQQIKDCVQALDSAPITAEEMSLLNSL